MQKISGPINTQAFISYARGHKPFEEAFNLVTKLYAKQKRQHLGSKYITRTGTVASLLLDYSLQPTAMVAAVLEETLQRTNLKPETIEKLYGADVLAMVLVLNPPRQDDAAAVAAHGEGLKAAGYQAQTVKIVSLLENVVVIPSNRLSASVGYLEHVQTLLPYLEGGNQELLDRLKAALRRALA